MKIRYVIKIKNGGFINKMGNDSTNLKKLTKSFPTEDAAYKWLKKKTKNMNDFKILPLTDAFTKWD